MSNAMPVWIACGLFFESAGRVAWRTGIAGEQGVADGDEEEGQKRCRQHSAQHNHTDDGACFRARSEGKDEWDGTRCSGDSRHQNRARARS